MSESKIEIGITLDPEKVPATIRWRADEGNNQEWQNVEGMILSLWDGKEQNAYRIDLWTKEMRVDEMNFFIFQTIATLADTFEEATGNMEVAAKMRGFTEYFAEKTKIFDNDSKGHSHHEH